MKKLLILLPISVFLITGINAQVPSFTSPVEGTYLKDYFIINYVDWILAGYEDYNCGNKSYNGHQGTDFALRSFAQMDSGVYILAAAAGTVVKLADTFYDRNMALTVSGAGNYIAIKHNNNYYTYYSHMKKKSALVKVGDVVTQGQRIGQIGSSGYSSDPQLHFEVWNDTLYYVDPFSGPCGNSTSMWTNQFSYDSVYRIYDKGMIAVGPTVNLLRERYPSKQVFNLKDTAICLWIEEAGIKTGDSFSFKWYNPQGKLTDTFSSVYYYNSWYYYNWSYIKFPATGPAGQWNVKYFRNGKQVINMPFTVDLTNSVMQSKPKPLIIQSDKQVRVSYPAEFQIMLFDINGKVIRIKQNCQNSVLCNLSDLSSGAYILKFTSKDNFYAKKLILP